MLCDACEYRDPSSTKRLADGARAPRASLMAVMALCDHVLGNTGGLVSPSPRRPGWHIRVRQHLTAHTTFDSPFRRTPLHGWFLSAPATTTGALFPVVFTHSNTNNHTPLLGGVGGWARVESFAPVGDADALVAFANPLGAAVNAVLLQYPGHL